MKPPAQYQDIQYGNAAAGITISSWQAISGGQIISSGQAIFGGEIISSGLKAFNGVRSFQGHMNPPGTFVKLKICKDEDL
jgi:hypothetical protein